MKEMKTIKSMVATVSDELDSMSNQAIKEYIANNLDNIKDDRKLKLVAFSVWESTEIEPIEKCKQSSKMHRFSPQSAHFFSYSVFPVID